MMEMKLNKYQTPLTEDYLKSLPQEVQDQLMDYINNVEFIKRLVSPNRGYAKDRPRDDKGRIIVDLVNPHILEDMDYFRPAALHFKKYGCFTNLKPNANPNSEYGKWIREERNRCWNGYVRESDGEWVTGYLYFYLNYSPIVLSQIRKGTKKADRVTDFPEVWEGIYWRFHYIDQLRNGGLYNDFTGGNHGAELARRGASKAHPYNSNILLSNGNIIKWGDLRIGDKVIGRDGLPTTVIDIPFNGYAPTYEITLRDGRKVEATEDHDWNILYKGKEIILDTKSLYAKYKDTISKEDTYSIPMQNCTIFNSQPIPIDAYTFGLLISKGLFKGNSCFYLGNKNDFSQIEKYIPYKYTKWNGNYTCNIHIDNVKNIIESLGIYELSFKKRYIPNIYKINSSKVRLELLKGIIDATSYFRDGGKYSLVVSSELLKDDILFICRSLGYNCSFYKSKEKQYYISINTPYSISYLENECNINENLNYNIGINIINIKYLGRKRAKCITVDNSSHCYLIEDFIITHNSYSLGSIANHNFVLGENEVAYKNVKTVITAYQKEYLTKDGTLNKFLSMADFCAENTQFPRKRLKSSFDNMIWVMGYKDLDTGVEKGTLNTVLGVSSKDNESKMRGKRAHLLVDEFGAFPRLIDAYNVWIPSVQEGDIVFGMIYMCGTAGDSESDFAGAQEIMYNPKGYNMYALPNVFDKVNQGKKDFVFFFPGYINRKGCYNENGVSDVIKGLVEILLNRYRVKYNSTDPNTVIKTIAEIPITPAEAIIKTGFNMFPITDLTERLGQLDANVKEYDDVYNGDLIIVNGEVEYKPTLKTPIRDFPHKDNKLEGAIEIFKLPEIDKSTNKVYNNRYIAGADTYDDDSSDTMSLGSIFILDLWTDKIVAEYTGRPAFAEEFYEICRRFCLFYNCRLNYENNKKGMFAYFSKMNSLYLLADTLEFLKDKDMIKGTLYGNKMKGVNATAPINNYARNLLRAWLLKPVQIIKDIDGNPTEVNIANLYLLRSRALIKELILHNSIGNFDRISAMGMLMLYREDKMILYNGDISKSKEDEANSSYLGNDPFFNFNNRKSINNK